MAHSNFDSQFEADFEEKYMPRDLVLTVCPLKHQGTIPKKRCGHSLSFIDNKLFLFGGADENTILGDTYVTTIGEMDAVSLSLPLSLSLSLPLLFSFFAFPESFSLLLILSIGSSSLSFSSPTFRIDLVVYIALHRSLLFRFLLQPVGSGRRCTPRGFHAPAHYLAIRLQWWTHSCSSSED